MCWGGRSSLRAVPAAHTTRLCSQLSSALRMSVGPPSSAACPQTPASRPASTVTRRATVRTAATSSAAVSGEPGGELWAPGPSPQSPPAPSSSLLGGSHPSLPPDSSPSASPGGDPSPGVDPGFPGPDGDLHLRGHRRPHPYHQLETQLGPHPLASQVRLWVPAGGWGWRGGTASGPGPTPASCLWGGPPG